MFVKQTCVALFAATSVIWLAKATAADKQSDCTIYAKMATIQATMAMNRKCGFSGPRWSTENKDHLSWCLELADHYQARLAKERVDQIKELTGCLRRQIPKH